jgi:hypothetical protein
MPRTRNREKERLASHTRYVRRRDAARAAKEAARMADTPRAPDLDPPGVVWPDLDATMATPAVAHAPQLAPLADFDAPELPTFEPFRYDAHAPLTPHELANITEFYNLYMSPRPPGAPRPSLAQALADAPAVLPLLEKQLRLNSRPVNGVMQPEGQEGLQVQRNLAWVQALVARNNAKL